MELNILYMVSSGKYLPVVVDSEQALETLNQALEKGWRLRLQKDVDRPFLVFRVPLQALGVDQPRQPPRWNDSDTGMMFMLERGKRDREQMALKAPLTAQGHVDTPVLDKVLKREAKGWEPRMVVRINDDFAVTIIEKSQE